MAKDTLTRIEERIANAPSINAEDKQAIEGLLLRLREEIEHVAEDDNLRTVAGFAEVSALEATKERSDPTLMDLALKGMRGSVEEFRQRHPGLVTVVNDIAEVFGRMGF